MKIINGLQKLTETDIQLLKCRRTIVTCLQFLEKATSFEQLALCGLQRILKSQIASQCVVRGRYPPCCLEEISWNLAKSSEIWRNHKLMSRRLLSFPPAWFVSSRISRFVDLLLPCPRLPFCGGKFAYKFFFTGDLLEKWCIYTRTNVNRSLGRVGIKSQ